MHSEPKTFYAQEYLPLSETMKGPIDSFTPYDNDKILRSAIETGDIEVGAFANCAIFSDQEDALLQKQVRYELKRAQSIYDILEQTHENESIEAELTKMNIDFDILRAVLIEAARKQNREVADGTLTDQHASLYRRTFDQAQADLYPTPDLGIVQYTAGLLTSRITNNNPEKMIDFQEKYPFLQAESAASIELMGDEKKREWHDMLHQTYDPTFSRTKELMGDTLSNATLAHATTVFMKEAGLPMAESITDSEGWFVEPREDVTGFRIEPAQQRVLCGKRSKEITWPVFEQLMIHEILLHVVRADNGKKTGHKALQVGMPGSQETEEGMGLMLENLWADKPLDALGRDHYRYMAVCYAAGELDGTLHTETETLDFVTDMIAGASTTNQAEFDQKKVASRTPAFDHVKRAFRGMPAGFIMHSNLSYLSGKLKMLRYLDQDTTNPAARLQSLQAGKINPLDEKQVKLMEAATENL